MVDEDLTIQQMSEDSDLHNTISRNIVVTMLSTVLYLVTRLFIPPIILSYVSLAEYGVWSYCFIILGYISLSIFGITNVYIRYGSVYYANNEVDNINRLLSTGIISVLIMCAAIIPFFVILLPYLFSLLHMSPNLFSVAFWLILGTTLIFMVDLSFGAFGHLLQSMQRIAYERAVWTITYLVETGCIIFFLTLGMGIYSLLYAYFIRTALAILLYALACYRLIPGFSIGLRYFDRKILKVFIRFGGIVQLSGFVGITNRAMERLMAGFFIGAEATALYEVGEKLPTTAQNLPGSINGVLFPATAHLHAKNRQAKIVDIYLKGSRIINMISGMLMGFMTAFAAPIITCWLGFDEKYQIAAVILAFFTWAYQADILTGPATAIYRSVNEPQRELWYGLWQLGLVITAAAIGFALFGFTYMVINVSVSTMMVLAALIYIFLCNRFLKIDQLSYWKKVLLPGIVPYAFGYLTYALTFFLYPVFSADRWYILLFLIINLGIYSLMTFTCIYFGMCTKEERQVFKKQLFYTLKEVSRLKTTKKQP